MLLTCGSVGSDTVYLFTVIPDLADVPPERKFVSLTSASSRVRGLNSRRIPHVLHTSCMPSWSNLLPQESQNRIFVLGTLLKHQKFVGHFFSHNRTIAHSHNRTIAQSSNRAAVKT